MLQGLTSRYEDRYSGPERDRNQPAKEMLKSVYTETADQRGRAARWPEARGLKKIRQLRDAQAGSKYQLE